jgi:hypothetical protein
MSAKKQFLHPFLIYDPEDVRNTSVNFYQITRSDIPKFILHYTVRFNFMEMKGRYELD